MEKTNFAGIVELDNEFESVWNSLDKTEKGVDLETEELKTRFIARAKMARRCGSKVGEQVLVFLRSNANGRLKECSRCHAGDWGFYFNHLGRDGHRIGMYCSVLNNYFLLSREQ